jgi:hypothetical protein
MTIAPGWIERASPRAVIGVALRHGEAGELQRPAPEVA